MVRFSRFETGGSGMMNSKMVTRILLSMAVLITAVIHLYLGMVYDAFIFILNGIGFLGLWGLFLLPMAFLRPYRRWVGFVLMGYSAITILLWAVLNGELDVASISAKLAELVIIVTVWLDLQRVEQK
ncbi:DUF7475 family protein [Anaerolinea thermophila]